MSLDDDLKDWGDARRAPPPTDADVQRLLDDARARPFPWQWWAAGGAAVGMGGMVVAALALVILGAGILRIEADRDPPAPIAEAPPPPAPTPWTGRVEHEGDVFVIQGTLLPQDPGRYALDGTVRVEAAPRGNGTPLVVTAADHEVTVVGTVFTVVSDPFAVEVLEGVVRVSRQGEAWTLEAGDRYADGQVVRPPAPAPAAPPLPDLDAARAALRAGDLEQAEAIVGQVLNRRPDDADAWRLVAAIASRRGDAEAGVAAWSQVESHGSPAQAQRARFEQGTLLGPTAAAIPVWRRFLATPDPLAPEARLALAQALDATGDTDGARAELQALVDAHPGTAAARTALQLLGR